MRATEELVGEIIVVGDDADLTPFIEVANELVTEKCTSSGYSAGRLILIETWLAAHFYACTLNKQKSSVNLSDVSVNYQSKIDLGLSLTHYGQMAMQMDTAGNLAALNQAILNGTRKIVGLTWLGTERDTDTDE